MAAANHSARFMEVYKDKYMRVNCFTEIGEKFQMDAAEAEKKITNHAREICYSFD